MPAYAYTRVSTRHQSEEGLSLEAQERQVQGYALMKGLQIEAWYVERGVSGGKPLQLRPEGAKLLDALKPGDTLIAAKLDRLFRSASDALNVAEMLKKRGVSLHLLDLGGDITSNGISKMFFQIVAAFAEFERERIGERITDVKSNERLRGSFLGGEKPFGYDVVEGALIANQSEQEALSAARNMRGAGVSFRGISARLKRDGVKVSHATLARLLKNELTQPPCQQPV